jgi:eukaryotic-like serine/threonine-protein kinase
MADDASSDLLFGLLALQNGLIDQAKLVAAFQGWALDKSRPIAEILLAQGAIDADDRALLQALAAKHLKRYGGDPARSLASLAVGKSTRESLGRVGEPAIEATLSLVGSASSGDANRTSTYSVETASSDGQRFRVLRPHARGGLGAVFVALDGELHREVALKQILDSHADDPVIRQRFVLEAEITGGLEHPGIVPVYGLGAFDDGRPYYAMRFIRGDNLKEAIASFHADEALKHHQGSRSLELRKLLRRFLDVCNAIDYAHSRGVLHRDIKPGNVIVGKHGETLVVDWGLAKPMGHAEVGSRTDERTLLPSSASGSADTLPGSAIGTPAYMSPEQACGDLQALGRRSDVYSLGATLYSLLTGKAPFEGSDVGTVLREVQKGVFPAPRALDSTIDRALEAVCLKAMATKALDRYASCKALADEVECWMADEPVTAWSEPFLRRALRFGRRNRTLVAVGAATAIAAGVCMAIATIFLSAANASLARANAAERMSTLAAEEQRARAEENSRVAEAQRSRAEENFRLARDAVDRYLRRVSDSKPLRDAGQFALRKELMEEASRFYERFIQERAGDPALEADLSRARLKVASIEADVGDKPRAIELYLEGLKSLRAILARRPDDPGLICELTDALVAVGFLKRERGDNAGAESTYLEAITNVEALVRRDPLDTKAGESQAMAHRALGLVLRARGRYADGFVPMEKSHKFYERAVTAEPSNRRLTNSLASSYNNLSLFERDLDRPQKAVALLNRSIEIRRQLARLDPQDWSQFDLLGTGLMNLATCQEMAGQFQDAEKSHNESIEIVRKLTLEHPEVRTLAFALAQTLTDTGRFLKGRGRRAEAKPLMVEAVDIERRLVAGNPTVVLYGSELGRALVNLSKLVADLGETIEAEKYSREGLELRRKAARAAPAVARYGKEVIISLRSLARLVKASGRIGEAEALLREAAEASRALFGRHPEVPGYEGDLGASLAELGGLFDRVGHRGRARAYYLDALRYGRSSVARAPSLENQNDLVFSLRVHGLLERRLGRIPEGEASIREALAILTAQRADQPDDPDLASTFAQTTGVLAELRLAAGARSEALELYDRAIAILVPFVERAKGDEETKGEVLDLRRGRARVLSAMARHTDALVEWKRILDAEGSPKPSTNTLAQRAVALARSADWAGAVAEVERLESRPDLDASTCRELSRALGILAGRMGSPDLADRAIAMLRRSVTGPGYDLDELSPDPALDPLRSRPDFQLLMLDLTFPADPFVGGM